VSTAVILVVDDDPAIRESLQRELRQRDYTTVLASDGVEGIRAFDAHAPDLVLADLSMPRSDGFELISRSAQRRAHRFSSSPFAATMPTRSAHSTSAPTIS
jgi:CheY-like chemotaxis protein